MIGGQRGGSEHALIAAFRFFQPHSSNRPKCARNFRDSLQSIWVGQWVNTAGRSLQTSHTFFLEKNWVHTEIPFNILRKLFVSLKNSCIISCICAHSYCNCAKVLFLITDILLNMSVNSYMNQLSVYPLIKYSHHQVPKVAPMVFFSHRCWCCWGLKPRLNYQYDGAVKWL